MIAWLICGSRTFSDYKVLTEALRQETKVRGYTPTAVVHGAAPGADTLASRWAHENGVDVIAVGAEWRKHGKAAGPIRNQRMLDEHDPALVVAFYDKPRHESRGTADMVRRARSARKLVVEVGP